MRKALVLRGGWPSHSPVVATDIFVPFLKEQGFTVDVADSPSVYAEADRMAGLDLILQCWTDGVLTEEALAGLRASVGDGAGLAGWHGGIVDAFRAAPGYLQMTGGQFVAHPGGLVDHEIVVRPAARSHPIVAGIDRVRLCSEQYWVLSDDLNEVLATTTVAAAPEWGWDRPVTCPAVWTRRWGGGRVFVTTLGHQIADLTQPVVRRLIERGLCWAARSDG